MIFERIIAKPDIEAIVKCDGTKKSKQNMQQ